MNRKGEYFRLDKLVYDEIRCSEQAASELTDQGFVTLDLGQDPLIFTLFTKAELHTMFPDRDYKHMYKDDIIADLATNDAVDDYGLVANRYTLLHFLGQQEVEYWKLLFFGHAHGMMTDFVIRDIGNVTLEPLDEEKMVPWFSSIEEAKSVQRLYEWDSTVKHAMQLLEAEELADLVSPVAWGTLLGYPAARKIGDKLMIRLGTFFEKHKLPDEALEYFSLTRKHPARERRIRILDQLDRQAEAVDLAETALESPYNASERLFAKDYLSKTSRRNYRSTTVRLKSAPIVQITPGNLRVERQVLVHFYQEGYEGTHAENFLWRGLFGLIFWEELFNDQHAAFHHPLQRMPSDLHTPLFYEKRGGELSQKLKQLKNKKALLAHIRGVYLQKVGTNNPLVSWHDSLLPSLEAAVTALPLKALKAVMLEMAKNLKDNGTGFPDLFIWKGGDYYFYEVKSPNDHLSAQQLFWLDFFQEQSIQADILRVEYTP